MKDARNSPGCALLHVVSDELMDLFYAIPSVALTKLPLSMILVFVLFFALPAIPWLHLIIAVIIVVVLLSL